LHLVYTSISGVGIRRIVWVGDPNVAGRGKCCVSVLVCNLSSWVLIFVSVFAATALLGRWILLPATDSVFLLAVGIPVLPYELGICIFITNFLFLKG
jgi:hypothetical protein